MIYVAVDSKEALKQGDIFKGVPRVEMSLANLAVLDEEEELREASWKDVCDRDVLQAVVAMRAVTGVVVTQNCDTQRGEYIYLSQIDPFSALIGANAPKSTKRRVSLIRDTNNNNPRYFYMPPDATVGFDQPMAADFRVILRLPRADLDELKTQSRVGRLNDVAVDHFREKLAQFFRRYAFNDWYPLDKDEVEAYEAERGEKIERYQWQEGALEGEGR